MSKLPAATIFAKLAVNRTTSALGYEGKLQIGPGPFISLRLHNNEQLGVGHAFLWIISLNPTTLENLKGWSILKDPLCFFSKDTVVYNAAIHACARGCFVQVVCGLENDIQSPGDVWQAAVEILQALQDWRLVVGVTEYHCHGKR